MNWKSGFKREIIVNIGDTVLFVKSFEVMTNKEASDDYELVEYIDYLKPTENIVTVNRYMYPAKLTDTLSFRQERLSKFTSNIQFEFQTEIENARSISRKRD